MATGRSQESLAILDDATSFTGALEKYVDTVEQKLVEKDTLIRKLSQKNDKYRIENQLLHSKLQEVLQSQGSNLEEDDRSIPPPSAVHHDPRQVATIPYQDYHNLTKKYANDVRVYEEANSEVLERCRKLKDTCKSWKSWYEERKNRETLSKARIVELKQLVRSLEDQLESHLHNPTRLTQPSTARSSSVADPPLFDPLSPMNVSHVIPETKVGLPGEPVLTENHDVDLRIIALKKYGMDHLMEKEVEAITTAGEPQEEVENLKGENEDGALNSSQTTATCNTEAPSDLGNTALPVVEDDYEPVIVSETNRKRKRGALRGNVDSRTDGDGSPARPIQVKEELYSSPPRASAHHVLTRTETLDLDEIGDRIDTPRKRRRIRELQRKNSFITAAMDTLRYERSTSLPLGVQLDMSDPIRLEKEENIDPLTTPDSRLWDSDPRLETQLRALSETSIAIKREIADEPTPSRGRSRALNPLSTNQRLLPRTSETHTPKEKKDVLSRGAKSLHILAEDGNHIPHITRQKSTTSRKKADMILQDLLENPAPVREPLGSVPRPPARSVKPLAASVNTPTAPRIVKEKDTRTPGALPTPKSNSSKATPVFKKPASLSAVKPHTPRNGYPKTPLRERPIASLRPDDFKLNPATTRHFDDTAEPVRGREARRHMAGCTDLTCTRCGDQLRFLAANLPVTVGSTLFASSQDNTLTEDEKIIKYYLGSSFDQDRIARMDPAERDPLLMKGKEKIISERHMRHRVKPNQRGKSPPGFWNVDMPSTQELEAQREEADRMERDRVEERHREAMRPGGLWVFKDE